MPVPWRDQRHFPAVFAVLPVDRLGEIDRPEALVNSGRKTGRQKRPAGCLVLPDEAATALQNDCVPSRLSKESGCGRIASWSHQGQLREGLDHWPWRSLLKRVRFQAFSLGLKNSAKIPCTSGADNSPKN